MAFLRDVCERIPGPGIPRVQSAKAQRLYLHVDAYSSGPAAKAGGERGERRVLRGGPGSRHTVLSHKLPLVAG